VKFEIHLSSRSHKFLKTVDRTTYDRIVRKIEALANDPFLSDAKKIMGSKEKIYRVRVGNHRILYEIYLDKNAVLIVNIDKRSRIYDG
jgi:mRNA interferase RelE/StbE